MYNSYLELDYNYRQASLLIKFMQPPNLKEHKNEVRLYLSENKHINSLKININTEFFFHIEEEEKEEIEKEEIEKEEDLNIILCVIDQLYKLKKELESQLISFEDFERVILKKDYSLKYPQFKLKDGHIYIYVPCSKENEEKKILITNY